MKPNKRASLDAAMTFCYILNITGAARVSAGLVFYVSRKGYLETARPNVGIGSGGCVAGNGVRPVGALGRWPKKGRNLGLLKISGFGPQGEEPRRVLVLGGALPCLRGLAFVPLVETSKSRLPATSPVKTNLLPLANSRCPFCLGRLREIRWSQPSSDLDAQVAVAEGGR
jgi:hypothetical protein